MVAASVPRFFALAFVAVLVATQSASAQKLFKYRDANGIWVYTDREPGAEQPFEQSQIERRFVRPQVRLSRRTTAEGIAVITHNDYFAPIQLAFRLTPVDNVAANTRRTGLKLLPPRSETELLVVGKSVAEMEARFELEFQYLPGEPGAVHQPSEPYRLPYALSTAVRVSQAFPDMTTHNDPASQHAIDFVMPVGTDVFAARGGTVIEVASDFFENGTNFEVDGPRANVVRILHDDGTMALYVHLNWNSIRVVPGQQVRRGEYLAESGNTGFSTGPHLHFVVQRNRDGALVSVPVEFMGANGAFTVRADDTYTAY